MDSLLRFSIGFAGMGGAVALGTWGAVRLIRSRRRSPEELERLRRLDLSRRGRITGCHILDLIESETARKLIVYQYEVAGVRYQVAQDVSPLESLASTAHGLLGQAANVKYDIKRPANSIIACEDWSGITANGGARDSGLGTRENIKLAASPGPST